jgi:TRAP-type C4-dicarboxylate transport system permease small subunit
MIRIAYKWIIRVVEAISIAGITLITFFTAYEVGMRELFRKPTIWTNEITSYLLVWVGLLGVVYAYDKGAHVSVDLVYRQLSVRIQKSFDMITTILMLLFALCVCVYGYKYWWLGYSKGWRHFGMLDVPMSYTRIALPIIGLLLAFQLVITLCERIGFLKSMRGRGERAGEN